jgi:hypothetical protein
MTLATALQEIRTHRLSIRFKKGANINFIHKLEGLGTTVLCGRSHNTASSIPSTTKENDDFISWNITSAFGLNIVACRPITG